jgi:tetratricopeptide (TPR) repeat protein
MPRYPPKDIAHTAATNHRIVRRPDKDMPGESNQPTREGGYVSFYREREDKNDKEVERDRGIALAHLMVQTLSQGKATPAETGREAIALVDAAVERDGEDMQAAEARAQVLSLLNREADALAAYETILSKAPHREASLMGAAMLAQIQQRREAALAYWRRAVEENPWQPYYRANLAKMLFEDKAWDEARPHCEAWLRLDPVSIDARVLWVRCLIKTGDKSEARAEFAKIERLRPANLPTLQARFSVELRGR